MIGGGGGGLENAQLLGDTEYHDRLGNPDTGYIQEHKVLSSHCLDVTQIAMAEAQAKLQSLSEEYQKLQQELQDAIQSRQKLEAQKSENEGVKKVRLLSLTHARLDSLTSCRNSRA